MEVIGNGEKITGIRVKDRKTEQERIIALDGVFVQIGLAANSEIFKGIVETNRVGEIIIDEHCRTNVPEYMLPEMYRLCRTNKSSFPWEKERKQHFPHLKTAFAEYKICLFSTINGKVAVFHATFILTQ